MGVKNYIGELQLNGVEVATVAMMPEISETPYSLGLEYTLLEGGTAYAVTGIGTCTDTDIIIPKRYKKTLVTSIESEVFKDCSSLTSITIPNSVTSIGKDAFSGCSSLTSITIPDGVTSIPEGLLSGCSSLETIVLPFIGGATKTSPDTYPHMYPFGYIFGKNSYPGGVLTSQKYKLGGGAYSVNYYIPESLKSVKIMGGSIVAYAFSGCSNLTRITINDGIEYIGDSAFSGCSSLSTIIIPNSVTTIEGAAFRYCTSLWDIPIPNSVKSIANSTFGNCTRLKNVTIPDSVTFIDNYAFTECSNLRSVTIPDSVKQMGSSIFHGCSKLKSIILPFIGDYLEQPNKLYLYPFGHIFGQTAYEGGVATAQIYHGSSETDYVKKNFYIPETLRSVTVTGGQIPDGAFSECSNLTNITLSDNITSIGDYAFYGCSSLTSIVIPDGVTSIGNYTFDSCTNLKHVTFSNNLTSIGNYAFDDCASLANIELPNSLQSIGDYAFSENALINVTIPNSVTDIGNHAFQYCRSLESVMIPKSVVNMGENVFIMGNNTTLYCEAEAQPDTWNAGWKDANYPVVWGSVMDFEGVNDVFNATKEIEGIKTKSISATSATFGENDEVVIDSGGITIGDDTVITDCDISTPDLYVSSCCYIGENDDIVIAPSGIGMVEGATITIGGKDVIGDIEQALDAILAIQKELTPATLIEFIYVPLEGDTLTLTAIDGMTWGEWVESEYNTAHLHVGIDSNTGEGIIIDDSGNGGPLFVVFNAEGEFVGPHDVKPTDKILANYEYHIE